MGQEVANTSSKIANRRKLSVIYFIDSAKTRSISISMKQLYLIVFLIVLMLTWSFGSVFLLVKISSNKVNISEQLKKAKRALFDYQVRTDDVFEQAYPHASSEKLAQGDTSPENTHILEAPKIDKPAVNTVIEANNGQKAAQKIETNSEMQIKVDNHRLSKHGDELVIDFDVSNVGKAEKIEGYIWAVAEFTASDGEQKFLAAPTEIKVDQSGSPIFPRAASIFAIKNFKRKSFQFSIPKDKPGSFISIKIGLMDKTGTLKKTFVIPAKIDQDAAG